MSARAWDSKFAGQNQHKTSVGDEQKDREEQNRARLKELQFQLQSEDENRISNNAAKISTFHQMGETEKILQQIFTTYAHTPLATWDFAVPSGSSDSVPFEEAEHLTDGKKANNLLILNPTPPLRPPPSSRKKSADSMDRMNGNRYTVQQSLLFASEQSDIAHHSAKQEPAERNMNKVEVVKRIERSTSRPISGGFKGQTNKTLSATKSIHDAGDDEDRSIKSAGTSRSRNSTNSRTTYRTTATDVLVDGDGDSLKTNKIFGNGNKDSAIGSNKTQSHVKSSGYGQNVSRAFKKKSALSTSVSGGFRTNPSPFKTTGKGLDNNTFDIMKSDDEDEYDRLMIDLNNVDVLEMTATEDERGSNEEAASRNTSGRMVLSRDQMSSPSPPKPTVHNDCEKELTSVPKSSPSSLSNTKSSRTKDIGNQVTVTEPSVEQTSKECMAAAMKQLDNAININQQKMTSHKAVPTISVHFLLSALAQRLSERRHQKGEKSPNRRREQIKVTPGLQTGTDNVSPSASPTTNNYLIYHTPNLDYQVFYDDWINSDIVLDALDNEQDDLGDRISSFVLSLSDIRRDDVSARFLESLNILLALHNDLRCPLKQHKLFWKAHCLKACPGNLVSILSRIALLSKSRNILLTILRSVLNRAVNQDKWLWDYAHSLHHGHRILINPSGFGNVQSPSNTQQGSGNGDNTSQGSNQVQSQGRSFLSQYKADTSKDSYLGQTPKQIRESARKTLNFAKTATPSFASPLQYFTQGKAPTKSSSSGNEDPSVPPQPIPVARDTRLSVIRTNTIVKPSQMASKMTPPNSQSHSAKVNRPDSGILNKAIPLKPSLALQQITEDEEDEGEEDENEEEDTEHDEDDSRLTSENAMRDSVMIKIKTNKARRIEESEEDDDEDEDDEEEQELIKKRKEQFRIIQRLSGLAPTPANITTNTRVASSAGLDETKTIHTAQEPIVINKDDTNALFLSCTAETIQDLVDLWKSSLPWKVEKFIFAGVDYLSELSIYPPEMFLVQPAKDGSGPTQIIEKEKLSKRKDSSKKKFRKNLDHSRAGSIHSHHQHKGEADDVDDEDLHDEMRNQFQPKMSLPLS